MSSSARRRTCCSLRWFDRLPADHALAVLARECGLDIELAAGLAGRRPYERPARLDALFTSGELPGLGAAAGRVRAPILGD